MIMSESNVFLVLLKGKEGEEGLSKKKRRKTEIVIA